MIYNVVVDPRAIQDIQEAIDYYNSRHDGLGKKFENGLNNSLLTLAKNPFFHVRYDNVHCLPLKKFPFMIHFTIDEKDHLVIVSAVLHTSRNPKNWKKRK